MKFKHSIQRRVFIAFSVFTIILTVLFFGVSLSLSYVVEDTILENMLEHEAILIEAHFASTGEIVPPSISYINLYLTLDDAPEFIEKSYLEVEGFHEIFTENNAKHYHVRTLFLSENIKPILVANVSKLLAVRNSSDAFILLFWSAFVFSIVISLCLTFYLSRYTANPVVALAEDIAGNSELDVYEGTEAQVAEGELEFLAVTIESALQKQRALLKRESDFNRDLSHELRTPLTVMQNALDLASQRSINELETKQINQSVGEMKRIVDSLLLLARQESTVEECFSLRAVLEDVIIGMYPRLESKNIKLELGVDDQFVYGNEALAKMVVKNLIENAVAHSTEPWLKIMIDGSSIVFSNAIQSDLSFDPTVQNAKNQASSGIGQGLYLIRRILDTMDWQYRYQAHSGLFKFAVTPKYREESSD